MGSSPLDWLVEQANPQSFLRQKHLTDEGQPKGIATAQSALIADVQDGLAWSWTTVARNFEYPIVLLK